MITVETSQFVADIQRFVELSKKKTEVFAIEFIQDLNEAVVWATPVDTGFLRGSWYAGIGTTLAGAGPPDPSGQGSVARMNLVAASIKLGDTYYAANGAKYAAAVEYGTKHMHPRAYVRATLARADSIALRTAQRLAAT